MLPGFDVDRSKVPYLSLSLVADISGSFYIVDFGLNIFLKSHLLVSTRARYDDGGLGIYMNIYNLGLQSKVIRKEKHESV